MCELALPSLLSPAAPELGKVLAHLFPFVHGVELSLLLRSVLVVARISNRRVGGSAEAGTGAGSGIAG